MGSLQPAKIVKMVKGWDWSVGWVALGNIKWENCESGEHTLGLYLGGLCTTGVKGENCESGLRVVLCIPTKMLKIVKMVMAYGCVVGCVLPT